MPDPLPRFIPGPLNLQIKHWATLLKVLLSTETCVFCITSAVSVLGAYKPCPHEAHRFRLTLFCSLLQVYSFWTCCVSILHQSATLHSLRSAETHPPRLKSIGWTVLNIIQIQTDWRTEIPAIIREEYVQPSPFEALNIWCWLLPKHRSSKKWYSDKPYHSHFFQRIIHSFIHSFIY